MTDDAFGFSTARKTTAEKIKQIQPSKGHEDQTPLDRVDAAGEALGFKSREQAASPQTFRRRREIGPTVAINTRAPERVAEPFIRFCEQNRYSYWEGIEELMKRAGLS